MTKGKDVQLHESNVIPPKGKKNRTLFEGDVVSYVEFEKETGGLIALNVKHESRKTTLIFPDDPRATVRKMIETFSKKELGEVVAQLRRVG